MKSVAFTITATLIAALAVLGKGELRGRTEKSGYDKCPYVNGKELKALRAANPYTLFGKGSEAPIYKEHRSSGPGALGKTAPYDTVVLTVSWKTACPDVPHRFRLEPLIGGPLAMLMPIRAEDDQECVGEDALKTTIEVKVPEEISGSDAAIYIAFPDGGDYDIMMLRKEKESATAFGEGPLSPFASAAS